MAFIPEDKLLEIKDAASIEEVVGQYVKLTQKGRNLLGLCPFHADTSPSFTVAPDKVGQAGSIKATVGSITGEARARVIPPLPWNETFDSYPVGSVPPQWVSAVAGKVQVSELDGQKVLEKVPNETLFKRIRVFMGPARLAPCPICLPLSPARYVLGVGERCAGWLANRWHTRSRWVMPSLWALASASAICAA